MNAIKSSARNVDASRTLSLPNLLAAKFGVGIVIIPKCRPQYNGGGYGNQ